MPMRSPATSSPEPGMRWPMRAGPAWARVMASTRSWGVVSLTASMLAALPARADDASLSVRQQEPRAYGYFIGDLVDRQAMVEVPAGWQLDPDSLPASGERGRPIELQGVNWRPLSGGRYALQLRYQVLVSPPESRTYELPTMRLRFTRGEAEQTLRIEAWPVTVSPLVPPEVSYRTGLGVLQPDVPTPRVDEAPILRRLALYAGLMAAGLLWLAVVYLGLPLWRRERPFGRAWAHIAGLPARADAARWRLAAQALHEAINASAGTVVFEPGLEAFLARRPAMAPLREDLRAFFVESRRRFYAESGGEVEAGALKRLARRARDLERGAA